MGCDDYPLATGPRPYYQDDHVTLYHGDCREILPGLPSYDLLLTDPPYGIAQVWKGGLGHGWSNAHLQAAVRNKWDTTAPDPATLDLLLAKAKDAVIWGGNHFPLPLSRGWLIWNKPERGFSLAEAELAWTSRDMVIRVCDQPRSEPGRQHPTQKPLRLMSWCLNFFPEAKTVLDPYAGSGTTLRAATNRGLYSVGIEAEERYCEIAARRLDQQCFDFGDVS
jgi:site-specific DNA-methyltransferase (adenine-specific)